MSRDEALASLASLAQHPCAMCMLADPAHAPDDVLFATEHAVARLDRYGATHGHVMAVLRGHETRLEALPWDRYEALHRAAWAASRAVSTALAPLRVWVAALGAPEAVAQSFPHCHVHVIPLHEGGDAARPARVLSSSSGVVMYDDDEARALVQRLRDALA